MAAEAKFRFVVATREDRKGFFERTAMGRSLFLYNKLPFVDVRLYERNSRGLPAVYNEAIEQSRKSPAVLVFVHDDVYLCDFYWADQMLNALSHFDIVGLAGNKRRVPRQPSWGFLDVNLKTDAKENLSGLIGHGRGFPPRVLNIFGPACQEVKLLDGVMLIANSASLLDNSLRFDERFDFHFYDLDFCRQAEAKGMNMGTWTLSAVHESTGDFQSESWRAGYRKYLEKWGD